MRGTEKASHCFMRRRANHLAHGADINANCPSVGGEAPLHLAIISPVSRPMLVSFLMANGASLDLSTNDGQTPLHLAAESGSQTIFHAVLDHCLDHGLVDDNVPLDKTFDGERFSPTSTIHMICQGLVPVFGTGKHSKSQKRGGIVLMAQ